MMSITYPFAEGARGLVIGVRARTTSRGRFRIKTRIGRRNEIQAKSAPTSRERVQITQLTVQSAKILPRVDQVEKRLIPRPGHLGPKSATTGAAVRTCPAREH